MSFRSKAQRAWMHATHPAMAKRWEKETPEGAALPEHAPKHKKHAAFMDGFLDEIVKIAKEKKLNKAAEEEHTPPSGLVGLAIQLSKKIGKSGDPQAIRKVQAIMNNIRETDQPHAGEHEKDSA